MDVSSFLSNHSAIGTLALLAIPLSTIAGWVIWVKKDSITSKNISGALFMLSFSALLMYPALANAHEGFAKEGMAAAIEQAYDVQFDNRALDDIRQSGSPESIAIIGVKNGREQVIRATVTDGQMDLFEQKGSDYTEMKPKHS